MRISASVWSRSLQEKAYTLTGKDQTAPSQFCSPKRQGIELMDQKAFHPNNIHNVMYSRTGLGSLTLLVSSAKSIRKSPM